MWNFLRQVFSSRHYYSRLPRNAIETNHVTYMYKDSQRQGTKLHRKGTYSYNPLPIFWLRLCIHRYCNFCRCDLVSRHFKASTSEAFPPRISVFTTVEKANTVHFLCDRCWQWAASRILDRNVRTGFKPFGLQRKTCSHHDVANLFNCTPQVRWYMCILCVLHTTLSDYVVIHWVKGSAVLATGQTGHWPGPPSCRGPELPGSGIFYCWIWPSIYWAIRWRLNLSDVISHIPVFFNQCLTEPPGFGESAPGVRQRSSEIDVYSRGLLLSHGYA